MKWNDVTGVPDPSTRLVQPLSAVWVRRLFQSKPAATISERWLVVIDCASLLVDVVGSPEQPAELQDSASSVVLETPDHRTALMLKYDAEAL